MRTAVALIAFAVLFGIAMLGIGYYTGNRERDQRRIVTDAVVVRTLVDLRAQLGRQPLYRYEIARLDRLIGEAADTLLLAAAENPHTATKLKTARLALLTERDLKPEPIRKDHASADPAAAVHPRTDLPAPSRRARRGTP